MATYKADHLKAMIREVVRQEIKEVVSGVIAEVLSERYLRHLAEATVRNAPRGVSDLHIQGDDEHEEETPEPLANTILGVGQKHPMFHKDSSKTKVQQHESVRRLRTAEQPEDMMSLFFEGTRPLKEIEEEHEEGVSLEKVAPVTESAAEPNVAVWGEIAQAMDRVAANKKPMVDPVAEENRIKKMREALDRKV